MYMMNIHNDNQTLRKQVNCIYSLAGTLKRPNTLQNNEILISIHTPKYDQKKKRLLQLLEIQFYASTAHWIYRPRETKNRNQKIGQTNLLDCTPLKLVSITIIENMTPEKPIAHSSIRYWKGWNGLWAANDAIRRWHIALLEANRIIMYNSRMEPMILSSSEPNGTKANMLNRTCSSEPWNKMDKYIL